jgi:phosphoglycerate dehydrogenase-like enzyme
MMTFLGNQDSVSTENSVRAVERSTALVYVLGGHSEEQLARIREAAPSAEIVSVASLADAGERLADAEVVAGSVPREFFPAASSLRWIHSWAAGPNNDLYPEMLASDVVLTSSAGNGAIPLAEHAMMLALMLNRDYRRWAKAQEEHRWGRFTHDELAGKTLGIFGVGNSGADLAQKAKAFHLRVLGLRRNPDRAVEGVDRMFAPSELTAFLEECDIVVVTAPLTEETRGVLDEGALRTMKKSAFLIVFSRGGIVDDDALIRALDEGWIAGAGLDAHGTEPLDPSSPFWDLPNTIITPHNGATTNQTAERGFEIFLDNLRRYTSGQELRNVVDKAAGY